MGGLNSMFSTTQGMGWTAPGAPTAQQTTDAYGNALGGVQAQQQFVNGLMSANPSNPAMQVLQNTATNTGNNAAQASLTQATNANNQNAAGLLASTKGINPALAARMAANQGAQNNQMAANQMPMMQLAAANQMLGAQQQGLQGYNQAAQGLQGQLMGMQGNVNAANASIQGQTAGQQGKGVNDLFGGAMSGASSSMSAMAAGGEVPTNMQGMSPGAPGNGPQSTAGKFLSGMGKSQSPNQDALYQGVSNFTSGLIHALGGSSSSNDNSAALTQAVSTPMNSNQAGESLPTNINTMTAAHGGKVPKNLKSGGPVPGKAKFSGDTLKNDTVPAMLSPGEMVIPRTIAQSGDPEKAKAFVAALMAKHGRMK